MSGKGIKVEEWMELEEIVKKDEPRQAKRVEGIKLKEGVKIVPKGPIQAEIVEKFLSEHQNAICDDCLSAILEITPRQRINAICNREGLRGRIKREKKAKCFWCGKDKKVSMCVQTPAIEQ